MTRHLTGAKPGARIRVLWQDLHIIGRQVSKLESDQAQDYLFRDLIRFGPNPLVDCTSFTTKG